MLFCILQFQYFWKYLVITNAIYDYNLFSLPVSIFSSQTSLNIKQNILWIAAAQYFQAANISPKWKCQRTTLANKMWCASTFPIQMVYCFFNIYKPSWKYENIKWYIIYCCFNICKPSWKYDNAICSNLVRHWALQQAANRDILPG